MGGEPSGAGDHFQCVSLSFLTLKYEGCLPPNFMLIAARSLECGDRGAVISRPNPVGPFCEGPNIIMWPF